MLIRSVTLADKPTRLAVRPASRVEAVKEDLASIRSRMREEVESELRAEQMARVLESDNDAFERARAEAFAQGLEEGREAAHAELEQARGAMESEVEAALAVLRKTHDSAIERIEAHVGEVAFAALCKLVGNGAATELFVRSVVQQVCSSLRSGAVATARLHPRDVQRIESILESGRLNMGALGLAIVPDESLDLGGCIVETDAGVHDGSLRTQLERLHAVLAGQG